MELAIATPAEIYRGLIRKQYKQFFLMLVWVIWLSVGLIRNLLIETGH